MKMFGFSRRRMKHGRLKKVQLSDSAQGIKSPMHHAKRINNSNSEVVPGNTNKDEHEDKFPSEAPVIDKSASGGNENWKVLSIAGDNPIPRYNHAAAVIGNKMIVVGGESENGLLDDVQVLNFDRFTWTKASSKLYMSPSSLPLKIPGCKGHSLVPWGKKALLIGGKADPASDRISVWAFDTETECWSLMEAKGDIPVSRSGHTVVRASSVLILFGGEDAKRRKLHDLHMFDLKSFTWLPLHCTGSGPSPRSNHVATLHDDKTLLIFGGTSKSRTLNDLHSLDFETMIWSKIKVRGFHPSPRAGCCGVLCGTKWYIAGGGSRKKRHSDTLIFDVLKLEWSLAIASPSSSITTNKGFSLVLVQHKEKAVLVAFGGSKREPSNQVEVLEMEKTELSLSRRSSLTKGPGFMLEDHLCSSASQRPLNSGTRQNLASVIEHQHGSSGRKSLSEYSLSGPNSVAGNVSLRKQYRNEEECNMAKILKTSEDGSSSSLSQVMEQRTNQFDNMGNQSNITGSKINAEDDISTIVESEKSNTHNQGTVDHDVQSLPENESKPGVSDIHQQYETKIVPLIRKNGLLEGQLAAAVANREAAEKSLSCALKGRQEMDKKLAETIKEMELLQERLAGVEFAQEEANNLSNIVHSDNVRLEHDVAFLKAVLDDTQKELHSTRGVLAGERARAFQLQVEVFHLKQRLQSLENRAPTPRKPFHG